MKYIYIVLAVIAFVYVSNMDYEDYVLSHGISKENQRPQN